MTDDHDRKLGTRTPKENDSRKCLQVKQSSSNLSQEQSMISRASCVARIVCTEPMNDFLKWPDTPKCEDKRQTEQQPSAKTPEKYREMVDMTCLLKDMEEKENEVQKRRHEEAKQERKNKGPKHTARRKLITQREEGECLSKCHICKRSSKHGNELCCDDCQTFYHELRITRYHKVHIPDSEDSDTSACHIRYKQDNTSNSIEEIPLDADNNSDIDID